MMRWLAVPILPAATWLLWLSVPFWVWVLSLRWRIKEKEADATLAHWSLGGIGLQAAGITLAGMGPLRRAAPGDPLALALFVMAALSLVGMMGVFIAARRELGRNWSFVARTRGDHSLVTTGPYTVVRHPIYLALLLSLFLVGAATGHPLQVLIALPLFIWGTLIRVRAEERLLGARFGEVHRAYVARTKAFIPGLI